MKEYFYISIGKHRSWITGANHIKTIDINIVTQEHYLKEPNNLKEFVVNILLIQLGSQNIHRMEIAYKAINLMCMYDNEVIKIISQNWKHLNRTQKEQFYFMAERWIFENKEKYIPFFEKLAEENEVSNTITDKIQLLYLLEKYNKQVFELKTNKLNYKKNKIDFFEEWVISTQFEYICNEIDIKHNSIISKINDGINTEKEICIGAVVYIPVKRKEGYEIIYSKNIKSNYSKEKNFYSIMPSYKILYCEEKELFETDVIVKSICNKICGLTYGVNSNIRIALSNIFVNKLKLKLKSIEPLVFADDKNREVKFEWIMYPYRDNIQESYVRYQTLYRWVCNKELFEEFLNKNNLQVIDNMDIQETQI